jgi:predicted TIM-barrel fold metal-dependent hydrolase
MMGAVGGFGFPVIDADGHGGEPLRWRQRIPDAFKPQMIEYIRSMKATYTGLPGGGMQIGGANPREAQLSDDDLDFEPEMRLGMSDPAARLEDMDLEGIDTTVMFPPGSGEEWALGDATFSAALCRTLNDARAEYAAFAPERLKLVAKLPMMEPSAAAEELERCVAQHGYVGMVTAQHILDRNLDDPWFDVVWEVAQRLDVAVCVHGGGQAPGQVPVAIDRFETRLEKHAITHPFGAMLALTSFTVGGVMARFPRLRIALLEAGAGWLPFWLERLDEHWELMPEQAPQIDAPPSSYFLGRGYVSCEPEERSVPVVSSALGDEIICYASDYCHWDCAFPNSVKILAERDDITDGQKRRIFAENAAKLYNLPVPE